MFFEMGALLSLSLCRRYQQKTEYKRNLLVKPSELSKVRDSRDRTGAEPFCAEFVCSPHVCVGFLRVLLHVIPVMNWRLIQGVPHRRTVSAVPCHHYNTVA